MKTGRAPKRKAEAGGDGPPARRRPPPGGDAEHVVSAGGFEDRRKYRVDAETVKYYEEIAALVTPPEASGDEAADAPDAMDDEQRQMLVSNALGEAAGRELHLALDPVCSRVMQALLVAAPAAALVGYLAPFGQGGLSVTWVTNPFGSHVAETLFGALRAALAPERAPDRETVAAARAALQALCDALAARALELVAHRAASPALRALLGLLSGRELARRDARGDKGAQPEPPAAGGGASPQQGRRFGKLLASFVDGCLSALEQSGEYGALCGDPACSAFLQAVAAAYEGDDTALRRVLPRLLGAARPADDAPPSEPGQCLALVAPSDMGGLLRDAAGSRLAEAVLRAAPRDVRAELHDRFMAGHLRELAAHACANFAVQAHLKLLGAGDEALLRTALDELGPELGRLLASNRGGVVGALLSACAAVGALQREAAQALSRALVPKPQAPADGAPRERDNSAYVALLAPALLRRAGGGATRAGFSVHGCAVLATALAFPPAACRQYADSVAALPAEEAAAAACDAAASRVLEALLRGGAPAGLKRKLLASLAPRWAALAVSPAGSHVVDAAYDGAEPREREALVASLAAAERQLATSRYGAVLLRRTGVAEFKRDPAAWRRRHAAAAQVRADFAELLQAEPALAPAAAKKRDKKQAPALTETAAAPLSSALQKAMRDLR